jgi:hypothetical protein
VSARRSRIPITVLILCAHGIALWIFSRARAPVAAEVETFHSIMFFIADRPSPTALAPHLTGRSPAARNAPRAPLPLLPPVDTSTAITLPTPPGTGVDWSAQLSGAAGATLENEKKDREQRGALLRKFRIEADPRDPHPDPRSGFRWYDAGIHRFDTRGALPAWHPNERCVLVAFIFAACALGHIEAHGDLFDGAAARHDESLATHRPSDAP